jgi:hypothetical protein
MKINALDLMLASIFLSLCCIGGIVAYIVIY